MKFIKPHPSLLVLFFCSLSSHAFAGSWLLGFSTADTVAPGSYSAIAGTGGQWSSVGNPRNESFTPFLAHAGLRTGISDSWDIGYRLATVALPYSSVGPSLGAEIDVKHRLTDKGNPWQVAVLVGVGYAYLDIQGQSKNSWSPGVDMIISHQVSPGYTAFADLRYVYTEIPSANGGASANHFEAFGPGMGVKIKLKENVSLTPEIGVFRFNGSIAGQNGDGIGIQYGAVLGFLF
ncbi:MAG: hypothetical protein KGL17_07605 [Betaproteobacteria bacterium]|nr:hypothetical protein [Betaproteobacteria bacterium]MDE2354872.1 hypothetical protein [Betaproteobacteria bacterium]